MTKAAAHRNPIGAVVSPAPDIRAVHQPVARRLQLGDEDLVAPGAGGLLLVDDGKVVGGREARDVGGAGGIHRHRHRGVLARASEKRQVIDGVDGQGEGSVIAADDKAYDVAVDFEAAFHARLCAVALLVDPGRRFAEGLAAQADGQRAVGFEAQLVGAGVPDTDARRFFARRDDVFGFEMRAAAAVDCVDAAVDFAVGDAGEQGHAGAPGVGRADQEVRDSGSGAGRLQAARSGGVHKFHVQRGGAALQHGFAAAEIGVHALRFEARKRTSGPAGLGWRRRRGVRSCPPPGLRLPAIRPIRSKRGARYASPRYFGGFQGAALEQYVPGQRRTAIWRSARRSAMVAAMAAQACPSP